jgi:glycoprotease/Kae1 family metallohydrolase
VILALETSCDDTCAAVVGRDGAVASSIRSSQADLHARFGGVVPEIASRRHLELVGPVLEAALADAGATLGDAEAIAVTQGPGLIGALLVGLSTAKALAYARGIPLVPVDHLVGHVAALRLAPLAVEPPFACLLASGGHTLVLDVADYAAPVRLGGTRDDAAGEAFDKGARLLGLGAAGGPALEACARGGDPARFPFPGVLRGQAGHDLSFSGPRPRSCAASPSSGAASRRRAPTSRRPTRRRSSASSWSVPAHCSTRPAAARSPSSAASPRTARCASASRASAVGGAPRSTSCRPPCASTTRR